MSFPFQRVRHLLIDLDGVLFKGRTPLPGAQSLLDMLEARSISFRLVTNNATLTPAQYVSKLAKMDIDVPEEVVFTSALATGLYLRRQGAAGQSAYVIGEEGLISAVTNAGLHPREESPDWVIVGLDRNLNYTKLATAALAIQAGARFVGSNPDTSFPSEQGLIPGAGAIMAALTSTTGLTPLIIGKPQPLLLELALQSLGGEAESAAMLGDRLDTDIAAANFLRMLSILVLTGVSTRSDIDNGAARPNLVVDDLPCLIDIWTSQVAK